MSAVNAISSAPMPEADDLLSGAEEIAAFTRNTVRRTNYLLEKALLPAFKEGTRWRMRKSTYRTYIAGLETKALERIAA